MPGRILTVVNHYPRLRNVCAAAHVTMAVSSPRGLAMMRAAAFAAVLLFATPAFAGDVIGAFYGHTMEETGPGGAVHRFRYHPDFTFGENVNGHAYQGHWLVRGYSVCLFYDPPLAAAPEGRCLPIAAHRYADLSPAPQSAQQRPHPLLIHIEH
jgi:hypothetical protein